MQCRVCLPKTERAHASCGAHHSEIAVNNDRAEFRSPGGAVDRPAFILAPCDFCHARRWYSRGTIPRSMSLRDANCPCRGLSREGGRAMDEFAYFHWTDIATLIPTALFMMLW